MFEGLSLVALIVLRLIGARQMALQEPVYKALVLLVAWQLNVYFPC